jgi:CheY-like chemotaxis protein
MVGQLNYRVLLVDDEPLIRKVITGYLVAAGFVVRTAVDGLDALQKLRAGVPDLIISDLNMPRMSGVELLHVVRQRFPHIPLIAITAGSIPDGLPNELGADACYHKSGQGFDALLQSVTNLTRESSGRTVAELPEVIPAQARQDGNGYYIIPCAYCLRSFSVPRARHTGRHDQWTTCVHCGGPVQFLTDSPDVQG